MSRISDQTIIARIERLPFSRWHARILGIVGIANFFDAFDSLTIAFVLPVLVGLWHLAPRQIGLVISMGFVGQLIGAVALGWVAERFGRIRPLRWTLVVIAVLSIACAFAGNFQMFVILRTVQGLGLGAENPIASTYINEMCAARQRGRFAFSFQAVFAIAIMVTSLVSLWVVPHLGWQWMFVIGALPVLLALWLRRLVPESPRWLASVGRLEEANRVMGEIEQEVSRHATIPPPRPQENVVTAVHERVGFGDLFVPRYFGRTLLSWVIMFCASTVSYGLIAWLPTIYRTVYKLPLAETLQYGFFSSFASVFGALSGIYLIDRVGRRVFFTTCFIGSALPLLVLWPLVERSTATVPVIVALATVSLYFMSLISNAVYIYIPEIYPTRMRALGSSVASAWLRIASIVGPYVVGILLATANLGAVFLFFGAAAVVGAVVVFAFAIETRGRILEEISP